MPKAESCGALDEVSEFITELKEDMTVPRNIRKKLDEIIDILNNNELDVSLRVDKAVFILDEMNEDSNVPAFTRTQIWSLVSMLSRF
jgi:hypothetical protein